ncbi:MAG: hypothetical protein M3R43_00640 [Acidobacteriota bacterium]|nr:hypothetical protein [Acidobacteriota bacterium]
MRRLGWIGAVALVGCWAWSGAARAQNATTLVEPPVPLLPQSFAGWHRDETTTVPASSFSLVNVNKDALEECAPQRSQTATYILKGGRSVHVEAVEFNDATGAYSAFTLALRPGLKLGKEIGAATAIGDGGVLFETGSSLALAYPATTADVSDLTKLANTLPKIGGPRSQRPLLPTFFPAKGLATGSLRYALGPASYAAMGGTFGAGQLGWEKSAEAALADYADKRGKETLTLLLYPTPQIAADHMRAIETQTSGAVKARREGELVILATGTFSADDTVNMIENIHLRTEVTFDRAMPPSFEHEVQKTYSLLASIAIFCAVGTLASVLLGVFLGGGRALVRKMQGKDAAADVEFLSLHLEPQNPRPKMGPPAS